MVGIGSAEALQQTWQSMRAGIGAIEVMVAEQIEKGVEVLVGCIRDEVFGLRVTIGSGGIWTNYIRDAVTLIPPFTEAEVRRVLPRLASGAAFRRLRLAAVGGRWRWCGRSWPSPDSDTRHAAICASSSVTRSSSPATAP